MSKWSILKDALTGGRKGNATASSSSLSIHRHHGFELYSQVELQELPWKPIFIDVTTTDCSPAFTSSMQSDGRFQSFLQSLLDERDLLVGYLREVSTDIGEVTSGHLVVWSFPSPPLEKADINEYVHRFQFSFDFPQDDACGEKGIVIHREEESHVSIPLLNSNFKSYNISSTTSILTREWKEVSKLSLAERMKGLMSNKLHGIDNTGNVRVWTAEQVLMYALLHPSSSLIDTTRSDITILELGAGLTGLLGFGLGACCRCCKYVHITDGHPDCAKNLAVCAKLNEKTSLGKINTSQLRWAKGDPHNELHAVINSNGGNKFDYIVAADCLFFEDFHEDLVWLLQNSLSSREPGKAYLLQPRRSGSMERFLALAKESFDIEISEDYCDDITAMHHKYLQDDSKNYDEDIHYPILVTLTKKIPCSILYNTDVMRYILSYLSPRDLITMCSVAKGYGIGPLMMQDKQVDDLFRVHIQKDFHINSYANTRQTNLPPGYFRKLYLDVLEERLMEENLIAGGH